MEIKDKIREARCAARLTQRAAADRLQTSRTYISQLETGVRTASPVFLRRFREEVGVNPAWWETGEGAILTGISEKSGPMETKDKITMVRIALSLSQEELAQKLDYSQGTISHIEVGRRSASAKFIRSLVQTLEINPRWWDTGEGAIFRTTYRHTEAPEHVERLYEAIAKVMEGKALDGQVAIIAKVVKVLREECEAKYEVA